MVFNLISPAGWQIGLVRIEDVAAGAAVSIVVGLLFWPRGARREFGRAVAAFYRAVAGYLEQSFERILDVERPGPVDPVRRAAVQARDRAGDAFDLLLNERSASRLDPQTAGFLVAAGDHALLAGDLLEVIAARMGYRAGACPDGARTVYAEAGGLLAGLRHMADRLDQGRDAVTEHPQAATPRLREAALTCLRRWRNEERVGRGAMAVVMAGEWVTNLARLEDDLAEPVASGAAAARLPPWR